MLAFIGAVIAVVGAIDLVVWAAWQLSHDPRNPGDPTVLHTLLAGTAVLVLLVVGIASLVKTTALRGGGGTVAQALRGTRVFGGNGDFQLRRLRNVVEEMAIASGVPVPEIYVLENESGINAFAAGWSPSNAAIVVTRGALKQLKRDELQGVIAHEFSHVLNGDMRLNIRLMGTLFGLLVIAIIGRKIMRGAVEADDGRAAFFGLTVGFAVMLVGYIGVLFGHLIKAGVSRSREFLADASAVQFTRQNDGIANALKKVAGMGSRLADAEAENVSHMLFAEGLGSRWFATHPPIGERIRLLDPSFRSKAADERSWDVDEGMVEEALGVSGLAPPSGVELPVAPDAVVAQAGDPSFDHVRYATSLRESLPTELADAARRPLDAPALLVALLLDRNPLIRQRQDGSLRPLGTDLTARAERLAPAVGRLAPLQRLPLALMAVPAVKTRPAAELTALRRTLRELMHADGRIATFEYALGAMLESQLGDVRPSAAKPNAGMTLKLLESEIVVVLTELARIGHETDADAAEAFARGTAMVLPGAKLRYDPALDWTRRLDAALRQLDRLLPRHKQPLLAACVETVSHDGRVTADEYEFLRVLCAALHCPLPPLLAKAA